MTLSCKYHSLQDDIIGTVLQAKELGTVANLHLPLLKYQYLKKVTESSQTIIALLV